MLVRGFRYAAEHTCTENQRYTEDHQRQVQQVSRLLKERRDLREQICDVQENEQMHWKLFSISQQIKVKSRWLRSQKRKYWDNVQEERVDAFQQAVKRQDKHEAHRLARMIASKGRGPRKRNYRCLPSSATTDDWVS